MSTNNLFKHCALLTLCSLASSFMYGAEMPAYPDFDIETATITPEGDGYPEEVFQVTIDPKYRTALSAEIQSPVTEIHKRMGETFKKGDVLIQLDDTVYRSNLNKADALVDRAKVEYDGKKRLFNDNVLSLFDLKEAEAKVAVAQAELAKAQQELDATKIIAPYDGNVVTLNIEEWELSQPGKELIEIVFDRKLLAKTLIPSSLLPKISIGQPFTIKLNDINDTIMANISRIGSVIDPSSSTIKIEGEIDNSDGKLKSGMTGTIQFDRKKPIDNGLAPEKEKN